MRISAPTQADIARRARVTQATVSMALSGRAEGIPEETRQRVLAVARELGYRANPAARRLAGGRTRLLGVFTYEKVFPVEHRNFYHPFLLGIEEAAEASGHDLLLFTSATTQGAYRSIYADGENKLHIADGAVLLGREDITAELGQLVAEGYPFVFLGRRRLADGREAPGVAPDYTGAAQELAGRLAGQGHTRAAYVGADPDLPSTRDRQAGLRELDVFSLFVDRDEVGPDLIRRCLDEGATALLVENSEFGDAVARAAGEGGIAVPDDVSLAVLGVVEGADPSAHWSGFVIPGREIGRRAVELVLHQVGGGQPQHESIPCPAQAGTTLAAPAGTAARTRKEPPRSTGASPSP